MTKTTTWAVVALAWLVGSSYAQLKAWPKPALVLEGHEKDVDCVAISSDDKLLASGGEDGTIRLWSLPDGKQVAKLDAKSRQVMRLFFVEEGRTLLAVSFGEKTDLERLPSHLTWWDVKSKRQVGRMSFEDRIWPEVYLSPDGRTLLTGSGTRKDLSTKLRDPATGKVRGELNLPEYHSLTFTPDSKRVVVAGDPGRIWVYDVATKKEVLKIDFDKRRQFPGLAVSPEGKTLAVSIGGGRLARGLIFFDLTTGDELFRGAAYSCNGGPAFRFVRKGEWLLMAVHRGLVAYDPLTGEQLTEVATGSKVSPLREFAASRNDRWLAVPGGADAVVRVWKLSGW